MTGILIFYHLVSYKSISLKILHTGLDLGVEIARKINGKFGRDDEADNGQNGSNNTDYFGFPVRLTEIF